MTKITEERGGSGPCEVPLVEQLRSVPQDYRTCEATQWSEDGFETGHRFIPVGHMMHKAADEIESLRAEVARLQEAARLREQESEDRRASAVECGPVCRWSQQDEGYDVFSTSCGREFQINDCTDGNVEFPFCPYCARRVQGSAWHKGDGPPLIDPEYAHPAPQAAPQDDADHQLRARLREQESEDRRDAERYRWLRRGGWEVMQDPKYWQADLRFDEAIDAARIEVAIDAAIRESKEPDAAAPRAVLLTALEQAAKELYEAHCRLIPSPPSPPWARCPEWVRQSFLRKANAAIRAAEQEGE